MKNIKLIIEYDGTYYYGWQRQEGLLTIQDEIEKAIFKVTREHVKINGSGRTDKGVHARGQVANFHTNSTIPDIKFKLALNSILPKDISIKDSYGVDYDFHARFSAVGKEYRYLVYKDRIRSALYRNYSYHIPYKLDICKMREASNYFVGTHDFSGFMASGSSVKNTVRNIRSVDIEQNDKIIEIRTRGNGFLYNMVRIIVGTLVEVGNEKIRIKELPSIISSKDRRRAGHTAPPQGLYLQEVFY